MVASLNRTSIISGAVVLAVVIIWAIVLTSYRQRSEITPFLTGCYVSLDGEKINEIMINTEGKIKYGDQVIDAVIYSDKQSLSILPEKKIVVDSDGKVQVFQGKPLLLRLNPDNSAFIVPSETGLSMTFQKESC